MKCIFEAKKTYPNHLTFTFWNF